MEQTFDLGWIDYSIMLIYFIFVLGIGWTLKKYMKSSTDFLEAGRSLPAWITGLAFIALIVIKKFSLPERKNILNG